MKRKYVYAMISDLGRIMGLTVDTPDSVGTKFECVDGARYTHGIGRITRICDLDKDNREYIRDNQHDLYIY